jgi:hypothetical protein
VAGQRRAWSSLSNGYRARLLRSGISQEDYERGASLKAARGHAHTPEKPAEYAKHPSRFQAYAQKRRSYTERIVEMKRLIYSERLRYNEGRSVQYVRRGGGDVLPPTVEQLRFLSNMTLEEFEDFAYEHKEDDDWRFLWYH